MDRCEGGTLVVNVMTGKMTHTHANKGHSIEDGCVS